MPDPTEPRLDAETLRWMAGSIRRAVAEGNAAALASVCLALAAEAESRPPRLSDYVRACDESQFQPAMPQIFHGGREWGVSLARGVNVIINDTGGAQVFGNGTIPDAWCDTPTQLRDALDKQEIGR